MSNHPPPSQRAQIKAMATPKRRVLTEAFIKGLPAAAAGTRDYYNDALVPGLKLLVTDTGYKSFVLRRRVNPNATSASYLLLGAVGELTLQQAREKAREWIAQIKQGIDPRQVQKVDRSNTVAAAVAQYLQLHVARTRKAKDTAREMENEIIARWGNRPLSSIRRPDIIAMTSEIVGRGAPAQARNILTHATTFCSWAVEQGLLENSPAANISPKRLIGPKTPRQRVLNDEEIRAVWHAADALGYPLGPFLKMLLLTGQRRSEVALAKFSEFDLTNKVWTIPAERYKTKASHIVPLSAAVLKLLDELPRWITSDYLFSNDGRTPITISGMTKAKIDDAAGNIPHWRIHDLRRTMRTRLSPLAPKDICELCIGHKAKGIQGVYDLHEYASEMRRALEDWSLRLQAIVEPPPPNVVPLQSHR